MTNDLAHHEYWEARAKRYEQVHDRSPDGTMIFGALRENGAIVDFEWLYTNASASRIVGRSAHELVGKRLLVEMPGNKEAGLFDIYVRVVETGDSHSHEFPYRHEGLDHWFRATSVKLDDGFYVAFVDLTARKRAEEQQGRLAAIVRSSEHAIYSTSVAGDVETWNSGAERLFGYPASEIVGRSVYCIIPEPVRREREEAIERILARGGIESFVSSRQSKAGDTMHVALMLSPIGDADGRTVGIAVIARDVSEEMRLRERLALADRMASIGTLAAGAAHEVNNPLAAVIGNLDIGLEDVREIAGGSPSGRLEEVEAALVEARKGADRIKTIIRGLMTFARADEGRREVIDLEPVLELAINMASNETHGRARIVTDYRDTPRVLADDARLGQVFVNLIANAAQSIGDGNQQVNEIRIATFTDGAGTAVIEVHDSGPGIPPEILGRIFDPFFTTRPVGKGTGQGLSIYRNSVGGFGGEITARNRDRGGATLRVVLPAASLAPKPDPTPSTPLRRGAVLAVDDEPAVGTLVARSLRDHDVTVVTSAKAALTLLGAGKHFDVVLSDLMMPEMSGMDFFDELVRSFPDVARRTIFISGGVVTAAAEAFLARIPNVILEKPFDAPKLRALVRRLVT